MKTFFWMILVARLLELNRQNSEQCSLFLFGLKPFVALLFIAFLSACQPQTDSKQSVVYSGPIMGTDYRITVVIGDNINQQGLGESIVASMNLVNQSMSNYIDGSELSQFNRLKANTPFEMSSDFELVMREAQAISALSGGAFDVTLAQAIDAWGFGPDGKITKQPTDDQLLLLRNSVGYQHLSINNSFLSKSKEGIEVSLSAIAKGYAVDKVADAIEAQGIGDYLINIGGELRASGKSVDGRVWRVGIEKPHILGGIQKIALLENKSIATSGDYRNYLVVDGEQFSHTIDPKTLKPVLHKLALVSVITPKASTADALATAMMVMGEERAWSFALENNLAAYFVVRSEVTEENQSGPFIAKFTKEFKANLQ